MGFLTALKAAWAFRWPLIVALAVAATYYITHRLDLSKEQGAVIKAQTTEIKQTNKDVVTSIAKSVAITKQIDYSNTKVDAIKAEVKPKIIYVTRTVKVPVPVSTSSNSSTVQEQACATPPPSSADDSYLDQPTVRLLNSARGAPAGATGASGPSDGKEQAAAPAASASGPSDSVQPAASGTSISALIQSDLDVTKMYQELATKHDALVDFVDAEMKKRAKK